MTAVFTTLLLSGATSAYAGLFVTLCADVTDIEGARVFESTDEISAEVDVDCNNTGSSSADLSGAAVAPDGEPLTAVFGEVIAITASHGGGNGFLDSETQANAQDRIPHDHYGVLIAPIAIDDNTDDNDCADQGATAEVQSISFNSPGIASWDDRLLSFWDIPKDGTGSTDALNNMAVTDYMIDDLDPDDKRVVTFSLTQGDSGQVCVFVQEGIDPDLISLAPKVGGLSMVIDSNALLLAGLQSTAMWMLPVVVGAAGAGAYFIKTRMNKD